MMSARGKIEGLPLDVRHWLERALTESGFSGYEALEAMLAERGYSISKSAIHRYGQKIEKRFAAIKASTGMQYWFEVSFEPCRRRSADSHSSASSFLIFTASAISILLSHLVIFRIRYRRPISCLFRHAHAMSVHSNL